MKKILIFMMLSLVIVAQSKITLGYGLTTNHYTSFDKNSNDYEFNENNELVTIEIEKNNKSILLGSFTNSFGNESYMLLTGYKFDKNNKGFYSIVRAGICKGYNSVDELPSKTQNFNYTFVNPTVFYKDYSVIGSIGAGYSIGNISLEANVLGTAFITALKVSI
jgi:hypothetical protein